MAKYDSLRKIDRNKELCEYGDAHPELSNEEIGKQFKVSASRAWRIRNSNKKVTEDIK